MEKITFKQISLEDITVEDVDAGNIYCKFGDDGDLQRIRFTHRIEVTELLKASFYKKEITYEVIK